MVKWKPDTKFRAFVKKWLIEYRNMIFAREYKLTIDYLDEDKNKVMISVDLKYLTIHVEVFKPIEILWKKKKYEDLKETLLHEICHILTEPMYDLQVELINGNSIHNNTIEETRERQTQRIANVINNLIK